MNIFQSRGGRPHEAIGLAEPNNTYHDSPGPCSTSMVGVAGESRSAADSARRKQGTARMSKWRRSFKLQLDSLTAKLALDKNTSIEDVLLNAIGHIQRGAGAEGSASATWEAETGLKAALDDDCFHGQPLMPVQMVEVGATSSARAGASSSDAELPETLLDVLLPSAPLEAMSAAPTRRSSRLLEEAVARLQTSQAVMPSLPEDTDGVCKHAMLDSLSDLEDQE